MSWKSQAVAFALLAVATSLAGQQRQLARGQESTPERLFPVADPEGHGFIDRQGRLVIPLHYKHAQQFAEGLAPVIVESGVCGYIDQAGLEVIKPRFKYCRLFSDGIAPVDVEGGSTFIDRSGRPISATVFEEVGHFAGDRGPVRVDTRWGFIDRVGRWAIVPQFRYASGDRRGRALVKLADDDRCVVIDAVGDVLRRLPGPDCRGPVDGVMVVGGPASGYAYIRPDGTFLVPFKYEWAEPFVDGLAAVRVDGRTSFIAADGQVAIPLTFDGDASALCNREFSEGLIPVMIRGKCGYIDRTGRVVIPPRFSIARGFHDGLAYVCLDTRCGYVDRQGRAVWLSKPFR